MRATVGVVLGFVIAAGLIWFLLGWVSAAVLAVGVAMSLWP